MRGANLLAVALLPAASAFALAPARPVLHVAPPLRVAPAPVLSMGGDRGPPQPGEGWAVPQEPVDYTKWVVAGSAAAVVLYRHDLASVLCVSGAVGNALLSKVLKRLLNEARPTGARLADPGMPSSHSQSLFFFASYLSCAANDAATPALSMGAVGLLPLGGFLAWQRVRAGLHTPAQVLVGGTIGCATGAGWCLWAQPTLEAAMGGAGSAPLSSSLLALFLVGALVVGSAERMLGAKLKRGRG
tara:strand:+ start:1421 stop:2152 length:732 start_codon:yes stop_codon:yes gene_type:complete